MGIRIHGGITEEQTEVQISYTGITAKDQTIYVHQNNAGEIKKIESECSPGIFNGPSQTVVAEKGNGNEEHVAVTCAVGEGVGKQPPDLTLENPCPVEAKQIVQCVIACHFAHDIDNSGSQRNVKHQVLYSFAAVFITEPLELCTKILQSDSTPSGIWLHFTSIWAKSL